eukprot:g3589.t1
MSFSSLSAFDAASAALAAALDKQARETDFAERTYAADNAAATTYRDSRLAAINSEHASDVKYIGEEQEAITEIRAALKQINFGAFLEEATKYDEDQKTYMATNSFDMKTNMLTLLAGIEDNINGELERAQAEFTQDNINNQVEFDRSNAEAAQFKEKDLADLQKAVDDARAEFKASDEELTSANAAHSLAADKHQEDRDDLATAKKIEMTNEPVFEAQYQQSSKTAKAVKDEEMEILDNMKDRGDFYLNTDTNALKSVKKSLTHLDVTSTATVDTPNTH